MFLLAEGIPRVKTKLLLLYSMTRNSNLECKLKKLILTLQNFNTFIEMNHFGVQKHTAIDYSLHLREAMALRFPSSIA